MEKDQLVHWGVKGMKWGVRRYQNADGSLTDAGRKRYERDQRENAGKKKGDRVGQADPGRWVKEDLDRTKKLTDVSSRMTEDLKRINESKTKNRAKSRMDLSSKTDKELRDEINRAFLEKQYNDMFAPQKVNKGRAYAGKILETAGSVLTVGSSALGIALAIKELRG